MGKLRGQKIPKFCLHSYLQLLSGEQALSKALVASRLCQAMADEAADDDLDVEIYEELSSFGKEFEELCE